MTTGVPPASLERRFEGVIFDWDGTAVPDRHSDAQGVRRLIEDLSDRGMHLAIITGTHVGNVDGQLGARPAGCGQLLLAVNRGSEIYEVHGDGPALVYRREATREENDALDRAAELAMRRFAAAGLETALVSQRLNRRKIDLIPGPEWADPPKARISELLDAVQRRLAATAVEDLRGAVDLALLAARDADLDEPRVTSDAKHVEIGLTDKSDSARQVLDMFWRVGVGPRSALIVGDELGMLGGLPGSDSLMLIPEAEGAVCASVGSEPSGVPSGVLHLGGGPARFVALLQDQVARRDQRDAPRVSGEPGWHISLDGIDHARERVHEAWLTIGDGVLGTSGAPLGVHASASPRVLVGGVYAGSGPDTDLVEVPSWDRLDISVAREDQIRRVLDLHAGVLGEWLADGRSLQSVRFCSLARPGTAVLRIVSEPAVSTATALVPTAGESVVRPGAPGAPEWSIVSGNDLDIVVAGLHGNDGSGRVDRIALYERQRRPAADPLPTLRRLESVREAGFDTLLDEHRRAWASRWQTADIRLSGDDDLQLTTRLALYHLMIAASSDGEAAVGPRALSGHAYRGHVLWDADVFVLPFLAATHPPSARAMLEYRVRRLAPALAAARAEGCRGARFPWESAASGDDVTPRSARDHTGQLVLIRTGWSELHVVADVAWAAAEYVDWSGDATFAAGPGHQLLVETARYWASRTRRDRDGSAHLLGVIGPDEYHESVDDNMFTNVMARWNLRRAAASARLHGGVDPEEVALFIEIADALVDGYDPSTRVYEQFAGFRSLEPLIIAEVAPQRPVAADVLLGHERVGGAQVIKQADVLMAHHLVPGELHEGTLAPNIEYYEPRTAHGSSLSPGVHAALLARAGRADDAQRWLHVAANIDLTDLSGTTAAGMHIAAMGSLWQALAWGVAGIRPEGDVLRVDPRPMAGIDQLELRVKFRGVPVRVRIGPSEVTVTAASPIRTRLASDEHVRVSAEARALTE
jgi:trehalose/maltose hydrolase-like predicted phosphorylase